MSRAIAAGDEQREAFQLTSGFDRLLAATSHTWRTMTCSIPPTNPPLSSLPSSAS